MNDYYNYLLIGFALLIIIFIYQREFHRNKQKGTLEEPFEVPIDNAALDYSSMYTSDLPRSNYQKHVNKTIDLNLSSRKTPKPYDPPCLTKKPYGNPQASYYYWKYLPNLLESQYTDCNKYGCSNQVLNGYNALPNLEETIGKGQDKVDPDGTFACSVHPDYYNSPEQFCRDHPEHYPCPNWWMKDPIQIQDVSAKIDAPCLKKNMPVEPQVPYHPNKHGFCVPNQDPTCVVNDGEALVMVRPGREDIALC